MNKKEQDDLKELYREAASIASVVPESMQPEAFNRAIEQLQGQTVTTTQPAAPSAGLIDHKEGEVPLDKSSEGWYNDFNASDTRGVSSDNTVLDNSLAVLSNAYRLHGIKMLSSSEIELILKEKFRTPASANQISDKLGNVQGSLVDRKKVGKGYEYMIMQPGEEYLTGERKKSASAPGSRNKSAAPRAKSAKKNNNSSNSRRNSSPGKKALLEELISAGYFDKPRTINDVIEHLKQVRAYSYKSNELSPYFISSVRGGVLSRTKNDNGQWQYSKI